MDKDNSYWDMKLKDIRKKMANANKIHNET